MNTVTDMRAMHQAPHGEEAGAAGRLEPRTTLGQGRGGPTSCFETRAVPAPQDEVCGVVDVTAAQENSR